MVRDSVCAMRGLAGATVIESTELICEVKFDACFRVAIFAPLEDGPGKAH